MHSEVLVGNKEAVRDKFSTYLSYCFVDCTCISCLLSIDLFIQYHLFLCTGCHLILGKPLVILGKVKVNQTLNNLYFIIKANNSGYLHRRFQNRSKTQQRVTRQNKDLTLPRHRLALAKRLSATVGQNFITVQLKIYETLEILTFLKRDFLNIFSIHRQFFIIEMYQSLKLTFCYYHHYLQKFVILSLKCKQFSNSFSFILI